MGMHVNHHDDRGAYQSLMASSSSQKSPPNRPCWQMHVAIPLSHLAQRPPLAQGRWLVNGLPKIPSKIANFHLQIVENRLQFRSKVSPVRARVRQLRRLLVLRGDDVEARGR